MGKHINTPYGGKLKNLLLSAEKAEEEKLNSTKLKSWQMSARQICDIELLINGGFSPLEGFMNQKDYNSVVKDMRLSDGTLWPMPITLDVDEKFAKSLKKGERIVLREDEGIAIAVLTVGDVWKPNKEKEAEHVFGTLDEKHPAVNFLKNLGGDYYVGGKIEGLELPPHHDFADIRLTPQEVRDQFEKQGWNKVVAFQTRNPMHRAHVEMTKRAAQKAEAAVLIHPVVGLTKPGDIDYYTRVHIYKKIINRFPESTAMLSLLPLAMRMGGPREAVWHAIIRKNYGASHFVVGRDHAGPGKDSKGKDIYEPFDAHDMINKYKDELGIEVIQFEFMVYVEERDDYMPDSEVPANETKKNISGTEQRRRLATGKELPEWFTYPEVEKVLRQSYPPLSKRGFTVFFTGLSGAGKSTIAKGLMARLLEIGGRKVTLLDGDVVRRNLSSELGFSKEHRNINVRRIGYVASEITKNGGIAICAPIAPYDSVRKQVRHMIEDQGGTFFLVHVDTPLDVCEGRDRKGLYKAARAGKIKEFTGISDPYEEPADAELTLNTVEYTPDELIQQTILHLEKELVIDAN